MGTTLHTLTPPPGARKKKKRVGRGPGSGLGETAGRGSKGQKKRSKVRLGFEGGQNPIYRRVPKRGFVNINRVEVHGVNVGRLEGVFSAGETVSLETLLEKGLVPKRATAIKLLADGELNTKLVARVFAVSEAARGKIEAAGGSVELLKGDGAAA